MKKLAFIGIVSCILVLLIGATTVSAAPLKINVTTGEGVDITLSHPGEYPPPSEVNITYYVQNPIHPVTRTIIPSEGPVILP